LIAALTQALGGGGGEDLPVAYGLPYPVPPSSHAAFFDLAGPLVGLLVLFSLLLPVAAVLRALVAEKEAKLREALLIGGAGRGAYFSSLLLSHGAAFLLVALLSSSLIAPSCFAHSDPSLVRALSALLALASVRLQEPRPTRAPLL